MLPVIISDRSLAQKTTTRATSSGTATRPSGSRGPELVERESRFLEWGALCLEAGRQRHGRGDCEDADPVCAELDGEALREPAHPELGGDVVGDGGPGGAVGGGRRDVDDDAACSRRDHRARRLTGADERPSEVDVEHRVPLLLGELEQRGGGIDARTVDPDVQPPEVGERPLGHRPDGCSCTDVDGRGACARADRRRRRAGRLLVDVGHQHRRSRLDKPP